MKHSADKTLAQCGTAPNCCVNKTEIMNELSASDSIAGHAAFSFPDLQVWANVLAHLRSSVKYPAMGADHPLPPECHDDQQRLEDVELSRVALKSAETTGQFMPVNRPSTWSVVRLRPPCTGYRAY